MYKTSNPSAVQGFDISQVQKLEKTENLEIVSISLEKWATFPEHTSP